MKLPVQSICGHRSFLRPLTRRLFSTSNDEYARRNYANNVSEYNTVFGSLASQRRYFLLRDAYDDMVLDGVQPTRDTFHSLVIGSMKGARLQDAFFFRDEMKAMGLPPDVVLWNYLISACGKCKKSDQAVLILEEMKKYDVKPNGQTYVCLLNACATDGRVDRVYTIVRDMTAAGAGLNPFCYAGLIAAHMNRKPLQDDIVKKILELVEGSKGWSPVEATNVNAENLMVNVSEEELYNLPTAEYVSRRGGFLNRQLTVYHVAFHAFASLANVEAMEALLEMLGKDRKSPDVFITLQMMRCYLHAGDIDNGLKIFDDWRLSGKIMPIELFTTLAEGAMAGYTEKGMKIAQDTLEAMSSRGYFLNGKMGNDLLLVASREKGGGYTTANYIWDLMQARKLTPSFRTVEAYYNGLKAREIPEGDARLTVVANIYDRLRARGGNMFSS